MSKEINYSELRTAMIAGCDSYLTARKNKEPLEGTYHGKKGIIRASKAKTYASKIVNDSFDDHALLLALLLAIFNSSSKGLAMCIALQLIQGDIVAFGAYDNDYISAPVIINNYFKSQVFSKDLLYEAVSAIPAIQVEESPLGSVMGVDKKGCVRLILNSLAPKDAFFKPLTKQFIADLNDTHTSEIDATLLDHSLVCF